MWAVIGGVAAVFATVTWLAPTITSQGSCHVSLVSLWYLCMNFFSQHHCTYQVSTFNLCILPDRGPHTNIHTYTHSSDSRNQVGFIDLSLTPASHRLSVLLNTKIDGAQLFFVLILLILLFLIFFLFFALHISLLYPLLCSLIMKVRSYIITDPIYLKPRPGELEASIPSLLWLYIIGCYYLHQVRLLAHPLIKSSLNDV